MNKIIGYAKYNLNNADHVEAMIEFATRVKKLGIQHTEAKKYVTAFLAAVDKEDADFKKSQASALTSVINAADLARDNAWTTIMTTAKGFSNGSGTEAQTNNAKLLLEVKKLYSFDLNCNLKHETSMIRQAIDEIERRGINLALLGLDGIFATLKENNLKVSELFGDRIDELADRILGELRSDRLASDAAYDALVDVIHALAILEPADKYPLFIKRWNKMVNYYRVHFLKGTTIGDDVADGTPSDEDAPADGTQGGTETETPPANGNQGNGGDITIPSGGMGDDDNTFDA